MVGGDSSINGTAAQGVDWSALRSYIAGKEAFEAEHGRPAPLTDNEVSAIAILLHFQQVRNQKVTFNDEARQEQGLGKAKELRWACSATFDSTGDVFPRPGYGMDAGEDTSRGGAGPAFQGKKDAKQWAAKAACEWLIDNGHMMPSGDLPKFPKPFAPAASAALAAAAAAAAAAAPIPVPVPAPSPSRGVSSGSVLPSKRSPPSPPPAESSAASLRKKQDMNQPPKTSPSPPAHLLSVAASKSSSSSVPSHQAPPPPCTNTPKAPKPTPPLNVMASPTSATHDSTTTSTASTPSLGAGAPISTTAQSQAPTPSISPAPTLAPTPQASEPATTSAEKRVRDLCTQLHFPVPRYIMTPDPALEDFWDGRADFDGNPRIPDDLGTVRRILHKKAAREKMAGAIAAWLEAEVEKRERTAKLVLGK
ncbi:hypothetical protein CSAL01_08238 [Colletotrichum salicis]|uniref:DRBM domain-containing protein n=1 Tax=Colletotrichum salicis TaxID=1209931 RepID=A0A135V342_9PEZI|nr:hypothetical protein CSAL01_08238 [Colletotrichum salicis]